MFNTISQQQANQVKIANTNLLNNPMLLTLLQTQDPSLIAAMYLNNKKMIDKKKEKK